MSTPPTIKDGRCISSVEAANSTVRPSPPPQHQLCTEENRRRSKILVDPATSCGADFALCCCEFIRPVVDCPGSHLEQQPQFKPHPSAMITPPNCPLTETNICANMNSARLCPHLNIATNYRPQSRIRPHLANDHLSPLLLIHRFTVLNGEITDRSQNAHKSRYFFRKKRRKTVRW